MRRSRPVAVPLLDRGSACAAIAITALWHAALLTWLWPLGLRPREAGDALHLTERIDIVFVPRRNDAAPPLRSSIPARTVQSAGSTPQPSPPRVREALDPIAPAIDHGTSGSVVGDDRWTASPAAAPARSPTIAPRPFARPQNPLARNAIDAPSRLHVRMQVPRSVAAWLRVLAPAGYEAGPCPELARAIAGLASDGAAARRSLLDDAVHFEAEYCR